jgi:hypothetical protein
MDFIRIERLAAGKGRWVAAGNAFWQAVATSESFPHRSAMSMLVANVGGNSPARVLDYGLSGKYPSRIFPPLLLPETL